jgi:hypothetical protein
MAVIMAQRDVCSLPSAQHAYKSGQEVRTMKLESAESPPISDVTEAQIRQAFADDGGRGDFAILSQSDNSLIQASGAAMVRTMWSTARKALTGLSNARVISQKPNLRRSF